MLFFDNLLRLQIGSLAAVESRENDFLLDFNGICFGMKRKRKKWFSCIFFSIQRNIVFTHTHMRCANSRLRFQIHFYFFCVTFSIIFREMCVFFLLWSMCHHFRTFMLLYFQFSVFFAYSFICLFADDIGSFPSIQIQSH